MTTISERVGQRAAWWSIWLLVVAAGFGLVLAVLYGYSLIRVQLATSHGKAELARAEQNRQIATLDAQAEVARARGVAQANKIIADGLGGPEGYLRYLQIDALRNSQGTVIYVPTEAGLPITEARNN